jgi:hypothetical protein
MKALLFTIFAFIFVFMVVMTIRTSLQSSLLACGPVFQNNPWAMATLYDAYFGFTTFFVWVAYRESNLGVKILWFVLIMGLGNIAMSFYVLLQIWRLKPGQPVSAILFKRSAE